MRALEHGLTGSGPHGLPLMGTGDWNDGMNRVGAERQGRERLVAWFLLADPDARSPSLAEARGDAARAAWCRERAEALRAAIEAHAWDGSWYRRAYFDDGTPLGSATNDECQIDSIAQTWAVISGAGDPERARQAMAAVEERSGPRTRTADPAVHAAVRPRRARAGLHQGLRAGHPRERRPVHPRGDLGRAGGGAAGPGRAGAASCSTCSTRSTTRATPEEVARYKVEPYVVCADVYGAPPHIGRGGWTWYTGSASWLYRVGLEAILGIHVCGAHACEFEPCIPPGWPGLRDDLPLRLRHVPCPRGQLGRHRPGRPVGHDGRAAVPEGVVPLRDDGQTHEVRVALG